MVASNTIVYPSYIVCSISGLQPLSCVAAGHAPGSGCCIGNTGCIVDGGPSGICYCDLACHAEGTCCADIIQLNCLRKHSYPYIILATNCAEAGKLNCALNLGSGQQELCNVTTPQGQCYCDVNCNDPGSPRDC